MSTRSKLLVSFSIILVAIGLLLSCEKPKGTNPKKDDFDKKALFTHLGNNIILPNYEAFQTETNHLHEAINQFTSDPNQFTLTNAQEKFKVAYKAYQKIPPFEFGPAEQEIIRASLNTFPADVNQINTNISSGTYDLGTVSNADAKGLPALDYLLFGTGADAEAVLSAYTTDANATNRKKYLLDLSTEIKNKATAVYNSWSANGGNYINTFINGTGTGAGSSLSQLVNELNFDYEIIKNPKIGIPLGKQIGSPLPGHVEAYYSGISTELAKTNVETIENIFLGKDKEGNNGLGLDDYLTALNAKRGTGSLAEAIQQQLTTVKTKLAAIPDPLSQTIQTNPDQVNEAYTEIQKGVVLLKTDMPSALGVQISYVDNDGD